MSALKLSVIQGLITRGLIICQLLFGNSIVMTEVSSDYVIKATTKLKTNHVKGPDGIPSFFITDCGGALSEPLFIIFNLCVHSEKQR